MDAQPAGMKIAVALLLAFITAMPLRAEQVEMHIQLLSLTPQGRKRLGIQICGTGVIGKPERLPILGVGPTGLILDKPVDGSHELQIGQYVRAFARNPQVIRSAIEYLCQTAEARSLFKCDCAVETKSQTEFRFFDLLPGRTTDLVPIKVPVGFSIALRPEFRSGGFCIVEINSLLQYTEPPDLLRRETNTTMRIKRGDTIYIEFPGQNFSHEQLKESRYLPHSEETLGLFVTLK